MSADFTFNIALCGLSVVIAFLFDGMSAAKAAWEGMLSGEE
jgi:hypothetical protein